MTHDPQLDARCKQFLDGRPRPAVQYAHRNAQELAGDVNQLTDLLVRLVRERDELLMQTESLRNWVRFLRYVVIAEGCIIGWFATELFSRI